MDEADALAYWFGADKEVFVAEADGAILGTYYLRANQAGGGAHVCNAGYTTSAAATGRGVASAMCLHSLDHAKAHGFRSDERRVGKEGVSTGRSRRSTQHTQKTNTKNQDNP